jgi:hypothetical protein
VKPGNAQAIADALHDLSAQPNQLRQWGLAGRDYVKQFEQQPVMTKFVGELAAIINH